MLLMKPNCESCDKNLPADEDGALICSYECTFCEKCMDTIFHHWCPNCSGPVTPRPKRSSAHFDTNPPSDKRVFSKYELIREGNLESPGEFKRTRIV